MFDKESILELFNDDLYYIRLFKKMYETIQSPADRSYYWQCYVARVQMRDSREEVLKAFGYISVYDSDTETYVDVVENKERN